MIEVNDNPSIDWGVEDLYLGNELYLIMAEFLRRMENRRKGDKLLFLTHQQRPSGCRRTTKPYYKLIDRMVEQT